MSENEVVTFGIDFKDGTHTMTSHYNTLAQYISNGNVTMIIVCQSGEILYDPR